MYVVLLKHIYAQDKSYSDIYYRGAAAFPSFEHLFCPKRDHGTVRSFAPHLLNVQTNLGGQRRFEFSEHIHLSVHKAYNVQLIYSGVMHPVMDPEAEVNFR